jgi:hypothetical protein
MKSELRREPLARRGLARHGYRQLTLDSGVQSLVEDRYGLVSRWCVQEPRSAADHPINKKTKKQDLPNYSELRVDGRGWAA